MSKLTTAEAITEELKVLVARIGNDNPAEDGPMNKEAEQLLTALLYIVMSTHNDDYLEAMLDKIIEVGTNQSLVINWDTFRKLKGD